MTNEQYYSFIQSYQDALQILLTRLDILNHTLYETSKDRPIHTIQHRIKKKSSLEEKLKRLGLADSIWNAKHFLKDIAGIRVICYFTSDIYNLAQVMKRQTDLVLMKEADYIRSPKPNGYRSYHLVAGVPVCCLDGTEYFPVEIQFRTMAMDLWASMEHRICYKKELHNKKELSQQLLKHARLLQELEDSYERFSETGDLT